MAFFFHQNMENWEQVIAMVNNQPYQPNIKMGYTSIFHYISIGRLIKIYYTNRFLTYSGISVVNQCCDGLCCWIPICWLSFLKNEHLKMYFYYKKWCENAGFLLWFSLFLISWEKLFWNSLKHTMQWNRMLQMKFCCFD